jgi:hypothetical protein
VDVALPFKAVRATHSWLGTVIRDADRPHSLAMKLQLSWLQSVTTILKNVVVTCRNRALPVDYSVKCVNAPSHRIVELLTKKEST